MVRERFDEAFEQLRDQSNRLADTDRSADNFDEIVDERVELDRRRDEVTEARKEIVSRYEPPAPDVVEPHRGQELTNVASKIAAAITVALLVGVAVAAYLMVRAFAPDSPVNVVEVNESVDDCQWRIDATVRNDSPDSVTIERVEIILERNRGLMPAVTQLPTLAPAATEQLALSRSLQAVGCPPVDEIDHGNLIIYVDDGSSRSIRF